MITYRMDYQNKINISANREVVYTISRKHRGRNPQKSHWIIKMPKEVSLFKNALTSKYEVEYTAWNLYVVEGVVEVVGKSVEVNDLKIAKFVDSNKNDQWHGYPADYIRNIQDIPPTNVLKMWVENKLITVATMKKLKGGQPCNL